MIINLTEEPYKNTFKNQEKDSNILVLDNGTYELKAGYQNDLCIIVRNRIYKYKEKISFEPFPLASMKTMFDNDVIVNFDVLENTIDLILDYMKPMELDKLIITSTPYSPTTVELIEILFSIYKFNEIQIGYDFIYSYNQYFKGEDCLVIALKHSSIIVSYIYENKIVDIYKFNFGAKEMINYINFIMIEKYKNHRKDYRNLMNHIRLSDDYNKEAVEIYNDMCNGNYNKNIFLNESKKDKIEKVIKKPKKNILNNIIIPDINYTLVETEDNKLDISEIKEKKKQKMIYFGTLYRLKTRNEKYLQKMKDVIEKMEEDLEKKENISKYIEKKKKIFYNLKRTLELREKLRQDIRNKKTKEFLIKNKEGILTIAEQEIKDKINDAEDEIQESKLLTNIDELANEIIKLDPLFIPFYANTVEILRGDNIGRECVNVDLIKWPEIIFEPSLIGSEEMGLKEILENICLKHSVKNILICGGLGFIPNIYERIKSLLNIISQEKNIRIIHATSNSSDSFKGAEFLEMFPILKRTEFEKYGAEGLFKKYYF